MTPYFNIIEAGASKNIRSQARAWERGICSVSQRFQIAVEKIIGVMVGEDHNPRGVFPLVTYPKVKLPIKEGRSENKSYFVTLFVLLRHNV